jgi:hypothetical protein
MRRIANIVESVVVVLIVLGFLFIYAPRFALGVTDPIHIALYNSVFLPLKDRG